MDIIVKVKTRAKRENVERLKDGSFFVAVTAIPEDGKANDQVLKALSEFLDIPVSRLRIKKGARSRLKTIGLDA
jgi:uncharacterized protein YggU (UPF0235/DUF167 family)